MENVFLAEVFGEIAQLAQVLLARDVGIIRFIVMALANHAAKFGAIAQAAPELLVHPAEIIPL